MIDIICITGQTCSGKNTIFPMIKNVLDKLDKPVKILQHVSDRPKRVGDDNDPVTRYVSKQSYDVPKDLCMYWEEESYEVSISEAETDIWRYATVKPKDDDPHAVYITIADIGQVKKYVELSKDTEFDIIAVICECDDFIRLSRYAMREKENNKNIYEVLRRFKSDLENRGTHEITNLGIPFFSIDTGKEIATQISDFTISYMKGLI